MIIDTSSEHQGTREQTGQRAHGNAHDDSIHQNTSQTEPSYGNF